MSPRHSSSRHGGRERGAALVEFALAMVFLPLLAFGIVDFARVYQLQSRLRNAAREGALFGQFYSTSVGPNTICTGSGSTQTIIGRATLADSTDGITSSNVTVYQNGTALAADSCASFTAGQQLSVTVTKNFTLLTPLVAVAAGRSVFPIKATATAVVQK